MKKFTLAWLLISTLCLFHLSAPETVFAQQGTLAEQVFRKHNKILLRDDIRSMVPELFGVLKEPESQKFLIPDIIQMVANNPDLLRRFIPDINLEFVLLMKEDALIKRFIRDPLVHTLIQEPWALDELAQLIEAGTLPYEPPDANQIFNEHKETLLRDDIQSLILVVFEVLKIPSVQELLLPATIDMIIENPEFLSILVPETPPRFVNLLQTDPGVRNLLKDEEVQKLIQTPAAIDELIALIKEAEAEKKQAELPSPDANNDGVINILDITVVVNNFGQPVTKENRGADTNKDGVINILDIVFISRHLN